MHNKCKQSCGICNVIPQKEDVECEDYNEKFLEWENLGECDTNPNYMLTSLRLSCANCDINNFDPGLEKMFDEDDSTTKQV